MRFLSPAGPPCTFNKPSQFRESEEALEQQGGFGIRICCSAHCGAADLFISSLIQAPATANEDQNAFCRRFRQHKFHQSPQRVHVPSPAGLTYTFKNPSQFREYEEALGPQGGFETRMCCSTHCGAADAFTSIPVIATAKEKHRGFRHFRRVSPS